jgi:hypothetical protein
MIFQILKNIKEGTLELQAVDNRIIIPHNEQAEIVPFNFVNELLTMTLTGQSDEVIFKPDDFLYTPEIGIEATASLKVGFDCDDVVVTEDKIEITLSGIVENQQGRKEIFILYFFMRLNRTVDISMINSYKRNFGTNSLVLQFENEEEQLNDSVFELSLYRKNPSDEQLALGQGKGFLFVGQDQSARVN